MKIMLFGKDWLGSNSLGLCDGFRELGHLTATVNEDMFVCRRKTTIGRAIMRLSMPVILDEFHREALEIDRTFEPDLVLVFKGYLLQRKTLEELKRRGRICFLFYPDVSLQAHTGRIPQCIPLYDRIITTKTFMAESLNRQFGEERAIFMPHAAASRLHRKLEYDATLNRIYGCDASFVGSYSPKKARVLAELVASLPTLNLKVWGNNWQKNRHKQLEPFIQHVAVHGDLYISAINNSKINLAVLSEAVMESGRGDQITSRTFHIPASGGFMLHERTDEFLQYYRDGEEVATFSSYEEMAEKVRYYLQHEDERKKIAEAGYQRTHRENLWKHRAMAIANLL